MIRKTVLAALVLLAGCSGEQPKDPGNPEGYALTLAVTPAPGGQVQRIMLPPAAIAALQRADTGDIRLFDGAGRPLSLALEDLTGSPEQWTPNQVQSYPVAMPAPGEQGSVAVRIDQGSQSVTVDAVDREASRQSSPQAALLLDTRQLTDPAIRLQLDVTLPDKRLVEVAVDAGGDLKTWEPVASKVLFKQANRDGRAVINLANLSLKDRYLRLSWQASSDVSIKVESVITSRRPVAQPILLETRGAVLEGPRAIRFKSPLAANLAGFKITGSAKDGMIPLTLSGRDNVEKPWTELAIDTLRGGKSAKLETTPPALQEYRIEADLRSAGFAAVPAIQVMIEPVAVLAALSGNPPYRLAVGNKAAKPAFFAEHEVLGDQRIESIPNAQIETDKPPVLSLASTATDGPFTPKKLALWAALLAATAVLAFAAARLMKAPAKEPAD
jgi:hypothetical protein